MRTIIPILLVALIIVAGCTVKAESKGTITMYKSPTCGCCVRWAEYMEKNGYKVETKPTNAMELIKSQNNIPDNVQSCHTSIINGYIFEGHIPVEVIEKVLEEKPDIDGIALPRMPAGSPGMPGVKADDFNIYSLKNGNIQEYLKW